VALAALDEVQVVAAFVVLSMLVPSLNISSAVYCCVPVTGIEAVAGVTFNPFDVAAFTVKLAVADGPPTPKVAVITTGATLATTPVARPAPATPLGESVALTALDVVQMVAAFVVLSMLVPSLNISSAVYCWVPLTGIEAVAGVTFKPFDVAAFTVKLAVADGPPTPKVAVMTTGATLAATPVARPAPATPLGESVALAALDVVQVVAAFVVLSKLVPSLNISHTVYCWVPLTGIEAVVGVTIKPFDVAAFTVKLAVAVWPP
jgi:hypothetical protein